MAGKLLTLSVDGVDDLPLTPDRGFRGTHLDLGFPQVRTVVDDAPDRDGTIDTTSRFGARTVTIETVIVPPPGMTKDDVAAQVAAFCRPDQRPTLTIDYPDRPSRAVDLRVTNWSQPQAGSAVGSLQVSWVAPSGIIRSAETTTIEIPVERGTVAGGRTYPLIYPRTYPATYPSGPITIRHDGDVPAEWTAIMYGGFADGALQIDGDTVVAFDGLTVTAGHMVVIDSRTRTVFEDGLTAASRRNFLDFAASSWAPIPPGESAATYTTDPVGGSVCQLTWHHSWLT